ncbi:MAG TPA: serine/threonine-protein kinase [Gemmataceae bacterium]|jgi:serine/threonine protein kinase|nr:serine/threonine-protein kinase [Gemmataceae bacterium]
MVTAELGACEWFVYELRRSNLIERSQLDQVVGDFLKRQPRAEAPALAEYLVEQGILSQFQAERVLSNKAAGLVLGPYVLADSIGTGSMGQVYKATSKTDGASYAVKVLPRRSMWNVRLARRQVRAFGQVTHPAVVPFVDVGTAGGLHYLVWPLVEGEPLDRLVQRSGQLSPEQAATIGLQIANGLSACHSQGIFHGLLKPSNIMVSPDLGASILDFGIGSLLVENEDESLVDTMSTANTLTSGLDCASPESIMEPTNRTPAGDQYSLGCLLYYCVTGRYPFPEGSAVEKMMAHQFKQPTPVKELAPNTPDALAAAIERLMQKSPEARFTGADEIAEELKPLAGDAATRATAPPVAAPMLARRSKVMAAAGSTAPPPLLPNRRTPPPPPSGKRPSHAPSSAYPPPAAYPAAAYAPNGGSNPYATAGRKSKAYPPAAASIPAAEGSSKRNLKVPNRDDLRPEPGAAENFSMPPGFVDGEKPARTLSPVFVVVVGMTVMLVTYLLLVAMQGFK